MGRKMIMKRILIIITVFLLSLSSCRLFFPVGSGWKYVGERRFLNAFSISDQSFLFFDSGQRPSILHYASGLSGMTFNGSSWVPLGGKTNPSIDGAWDISNLCRPTAILDSNGAPIVAYNHDEVLVENKIDTNGDGVLETVWETKPGQMISRFDGGEWITISSFPNNDTHSDGTQIERNISCITKTLSGEIIVGIHEKESLISGTSSEALRFYSIGVNGLQLSAIPDLSERGNLNLEFGPDGRAYACFSYLDQYHPQRSIRVYRLDSGSWGLIGSTEFALAANARLHFDSKGNVFIAFMQAVIISPSSIPPICDYYPRVYVLKDGIWSDTLPTPSSFISRFGRFDSITLPDDSIAFAFNDTSLELGDEISVLRYSGSTCEYLGSRQFTNGKSGYSPSLALSPDDTLYVAFIEYFGQPELSVMRYDL
jgi:hypothetical protein